MRLCLLVFTTASLWAQAVGGPSEIGLSIGGAGSVGPVATTPASPVNSVQFNNSGAFGGSLGVTWDAVDSAFGGRWSAGTTLSGDILAGATTIGLTSTADLPANGLLLLDTAWTGASIEVVSYSAISGSSVTGVVRGLRGTTAAAHLSGSLVSVISFTIYTDQSGLPFMHINSPVFGSGQEGYTDLVFNSSVDDNVSGGIEMYSPPNGANGGITMLSNFTLTGDAAPPAVQWFSSRGGPGSRAVSVIGDVGMLVDSEFFTSGSLQFRNATFFRSYLEAAGATINSAAFMFASANGAASEQAEERMYISSTGGTAIGSGNCPNTVVPAAYNCQESVLPTATLDVADRRAGKATMFRIRAGATQSTTPIVDVQNNSGTSLAGFGATGTAYAAGGSANLGVCWKADGKTLGNGTIAEITAGTCH